MKPVVKTTLIAGAALVVGAVGGFCLPALYIAKFYEGKSMGMYAYEVHASVVLLRELRDDKTGAAIEQLERTLDRDIPGLRTKESFRPSFNEVISGALSEAVEYRSRFPRTTDDPDRDAQVRRALVRNADSAKATLAPGGNAQ